MAHVEDCWFTTVKGSHGSMRREPTSEAETAGSTSA